MKLVDLIPKETGNQLFFTDEQRDAISDLIKKSDLSSKVSNHASKVDVSGGDDNTIEALPQGFHLELAEKIDEVLPDASIAAKITLFNAAETSFIKGAKDIIDMRFTLKNLGSLGEVLEKAFVSKG